MDTHVKAARAKQLLEDEVFKEALDMVLSAQVGVFQYPTSSEEEIMEAHRMVRALDALETQLVSFIVDGKISEHRNKEQHRG